MPASKAAAGAGICRPACCTQAGEGFDIQDQPALPADSGAFRSGRVPILKESAGFVAF
jgi:hypothetical protein